MDIHDRDMEASMESSHSLSILGVVHMRAEELSPCSEFLFLGLVHMYPRLVEATDTEMVQASHHRQERVIAMETVQVLCAVKRRVSTARKSSRNMRSQLNTVTVPNVPKCSQ